MDSQRAYRKRLYALTVAWTLASIVCVYGGWLLVIGAVMGGPLTMRVLGMMGVAGVLASMELLGRSDEPQGRHNLEALLALGLVLILLAICAAAVPYNLGGLAGIAAWAFNTLVGQDRAEALFDELRLLKMNDEAD